MRCPNGDGKMHKHTRTDADGYHISYHSCLVCGGIWVDAFSANQLRVSDIQKSRKTARPSSHPAIPACPQCHKQLIHARGDNIPPSLVAWRCPDNHGYYFDEDEFVRFKHAQDIKISYHKLWHIPLGSPTQVLLTAVLITVLGAGLVSGLISVQEHQTTQTQAQDIIASQRTIINAADHTVTFVSTTNTNARVYLRIHDIWNADQQMSTRDGLTHIFTTDDIAPGTYKYHYIVKTDDGDVESRTYMFILTDDPR